MGIKKDSVFGKGPNGDLSKLGPNDNFGNLEMVLEK